MVSIYFRLELTEYAQNCVPKVYVKKIILSANTGFTLRNSKSQSVYNRNLPVLKKLI